MTRYKPTLFKKVVSMLAAAAMLITFMPKLDFGIEAHAEYVINYVETDATHGTGEVTINKSTNLTLLTRDVFHKTSGELLGTFYTYGYNFVDNSPTTASFQLEPGSYSYLYETADDFVTFSSGTAGDYKIEGRLYNEDTGNPEPDYTRTLTIHVVDPSVLTVSFEENGGTTVSDYTNVANGSVISAPTPPTKTGYAFGGWYKDEKLNMSWNFASDTVTANITLYAKWNQTDFTPPDAPSELYLTSESDSGSSSTDGITFDKSLTIMGKAEAYSTVTLYDTDGTTVLGTATTDINGNWTAITSDLTEGVHTITATATDAVGNTSVASSALQEVTVDTTRPAAPVITSIADDTGSSPSDFITNEDTLIISGTSEPNAKVNVYKTDGVVSDEYLDTVTADASGNWSYNFIGNAGTTGYIITGVQFDIAGNHSLQGNHNMIIDKDAPALVSIINPPGGTYTAGQDIDIILETSGDAQIVGAPRLTLNIGGTTKYANYVEKIVQDRFRFRYTVEDGLNDPDGITIQGTNFGSGPIQDTAGNRLSVNFTPRTISNVLVDTKSPSWNNTQYPTAGWYKNGEAIQLTVGFDEKVDVDCFGGRPYILADIGGQTVHMEYVSGSGTNFLVFSYVVTANMYDADGIDAANDIILNGGTMKDAAGNPIVTTINGGACPGVNVDSKPPVVTGVFDGQISPESITISFDEGTATLAKDGGAPAAFESGTKVSANGSYVLVVDDDYNNQTTLSFTIDIPPEYRVDFITPPGVTPITSQLITAGLKALQPDAPTLEGNNFDGWYDGATKWDFANMAVNSPLSLFAMFSLKQCTINYYISTQEDPIAVQIKPYGSLIGAITAIPPNGYDFDGWYNGETKWNKDTDQVKSDLNLMARFKIQTYNVSYITNTDETADFGTTADYNTKLMAPETPTRLGYDFVGWYDGETKWDFANMVVTGNLTLHARYSLKQFTVTYIMNDTDPPFPVSNIPYGTLAVPITPSPVTGYDFLGWYNGETKWNLGADTVKSDLTLTAKYKIQTYNVSYVTNTDETANSSTTANFNTKLTAPATPTKTGYDFVGWYMGDEKWNFDSCYVTSNLELSARWAIKLFTVTIQKNNGSDINPNVPYGTKIGKLADPVKEGNTFLGWYNGDTKWNFDTDTVTSNLIITAKFAPKTYQVIIDKANGNTFKIVDDYQYDSLVNELGVPTYDGYEFLGWYVGDTKWDFATDRVKGDIMLTAKWVKKTIKITEVPAELSNPSAPPTVSAPSNAFDTSVEMRIVKQPEIEDQLREEFRSFLGNGKGNFVILPLSITLYEKGTNKAVQPINGAPVTLTIPVPPNMREQASKVVVYYFDNGEWSALNTSVLYKSGGPFITVSVSHFSPYALVVDKDGVLENFNDRNNTPAKPTDNPNTSGKTPDIMLALIGLSALVIGRRLKFVLKSK